MKHLNGNHPSPESFQTKYFQSWSRGRQRWSYSSTEFCMESFTSGKFCHPHSKRDYHIGLQKFNRHSFRKKYGVESTASILMAEIRNKQMIMHHNIFQMSLMHRCFIPNLSSSTASLIQIDFCWLYFLVKGEKTQSQVPPFLSFQNFCGLVKFGVFFQNQKEILYINKKQYPPGPHFSSDSWNVEWKNRAVLSELGQCGCHHDGLADWNCPRLKVDAFDVW